MPTPRRGPSASLVVLPPVRGDERARATPAAPDGDDVTLVDPGPGAVQRAAEAGVPVERIARVVLTHHHPDHCLDLAALFFARRIGSVAARCGRLDVFGAAGTARLARGLREAFGPGVLGDPETVAIHEVGPGPVALSSRIAAEAVAVEHSPASLAWRLTIDGGPVLAFSGDTGDCEGAVAAGRDADVYVLEAAYPDGHGVPQHLTPESALRIARESGCRHLVLNHFYPEVDVDALRRRAREAFPGRVTLAEDGLRVALAPRPAEAVR